MWQPHALWFFKEYSAICLWTIYYSAFRKRFHCVRFMNCDTPSVPVTVHFIISGCHAWQYCYTNLQRSWGASGAITSAKINPLHTSKNNLKRSTRISQSNRVSPSVRANRPRLSQNGDYRHDKSIHRIMLLYKNLYLPKLRYFDMFSSLRSNNEIILYINYYNTVVLLSTFVDNRLGTLTNTPSYTYYLFF